MAADDHGDARRRARRRRRPRPRAPCADRPSPQPRRGVHRPGSRMRDGARRPVRSTTGATGPTTASGAGARPAGAVPPVDPPRPRPAPGWRQKVFPWTLLGLATVPAIVNVGMGYVAKDTPVEDFEFITYREYVGVSTALLLFVALTAPDVMCPDRRQRVLPLIFARPLTGADYVLAKVGGHRRDRVRLRVPAAGRAVRRPDARERRRRPRLLPRERRGALAGADRGGVLGAFYAVVGLAIASPPRGGSWAASPSWPSCSDLDRRRHRHRGPTTDPSGWSWSTSSRLPLYLRDLVFLGHHRPRRRPCRHRGRRRAASRSTSSCWSRRLASDPGVAVPLPMGETMTSCPPPPAPRALRVIRASRRCPPMRPSCQDVSVWFGQKVALSEVAARSAPASRACSVPTAPARRR